MPRAVYAATATIVACTATLTALKLSGRLDASKQGQRVWAAWQKVLGLAGLAVVPQVRKVACQPAWLRAKLGLDMTFFPGIAGHGLSTTFGEGAQALWQQSYVPLGLRAGGTPWPR